MLLHIFADWPRTRPEEIFMVSIFASSLHRGHTYPTGPAHRHLAPYTYATSTATRDSPSTEKMEEPQRRVHEGIVLTTKDKTSILKGEMLNDEHVSFAQQLLKVQLSSLKGLCSTLFQSKKQSLTECRQALQIVHSRGNNWIAALTVNINDGTVHVYDSVCDTLDEDTKSIISAMFHSTQFHHAKLVVPTQKQKGGRDCGLFSIANITAIAFNLDPTTITFDQTIMREHLVQCMEKHALMPFPTKDSFIIVMLSIVIT